jgi:hypothetical protein
MTITKKGQMPDGTTLQIEDWSQDYPATFSKDSILATYPVCQWPVQIPFGPKLGERFRAELSFASAEECERAFAQLVSGEKRLADFVPQLWRKDYAPAILGGPQP